MNVSEINPGTLGTLGKYFATALPLTIITAWIMIAFQYETILPPGTSIYERLAWPIFFLMKLFEDWRKKDKQTTDPFSITTFYEDGQKRRNVIYSITEEGWERPIH